MNYEFHEESLRVWEGVKRAFRYLEFHRTRKTAQETIIYEPSCHKIDYAPEIGCVVIVFNRNQFPEEKSIDDLKQAKAQAIFRAYVGQRVRLHYDENNVYLSAPANIADRTRVTTH